MKRLLLLVVLIVAACSPAADPEPTPDIAAIVDATVTARETEFFQPELVSPANEATFESAEEVVLEWEWVRDLREGEAYDVRVWQEGEPQFGITWAQGNNWELASWLGQREPGEYFWSIAVIQGADGAVEAVLGEAPEPFSFTVNDTTLPEMTPEPTEAPVTAETLMVLPAGFEANIYQHMAHTPAAISVILFDEQGDMLVLTIDGRIFRLIDTDDDGVVDIEQIIWQDDEEADDFVNLEWAVGMALYEDRIYVSDEGRIGYFEDTDEDSLLDTYTQIVEGLPARIFPLHSNNGIAFDPDGKLYVAIGSTTDHGPLQVEYESSILRMNPDGSELEVFATGFRNPYDLAFSPDGELFSADNAADRPDQDMEWYPPEELNHVREGRDYGFPDVYGNNLQARPPQGETEPPVTEFVTSVVTVGLTYYAADHFPEYYQDGVFVAHFGGFTNQGREVVFVPLEPTDDGSYTGRYESFADFNRGFNVVDVTVGPDGALYVVEYSQGYILRVTYTGDDE